METDAFEQKKEPENGDLNNKILDLSTRIRLLEERYGNFRREEQLTEQNLIEMEKTIGKEFKEIDEQLLELKREIANLKDDLSVMVSEMKKAVKLPEFKALQKYIELWSPVEFITRAEAEDIAKKKTL
jgi:predicted  nucleic acid-binding Zn-ribbon protein